MSKKSQSPRSEIARRMLEGQRQMLRVQRRLFDNTFQALSALQNQQQAMIDRFVDSNRVPDEARDLVDTWREAAAAQRGQFRYAVEQSFESFDHLLQRLARTTESGSAEAQSTGTKQARSGSASKKTATTKKKTAKKKTAKKKATKKTAKKKATKKKTAKKKAGKKTTKKKR